MKIRQKLLLFLSGTLTILFLTMYAIFLFSFQRYSKYVLHHSESLLEEKYQQALRTNTEIGVSLMQAIQHLDHLSEKEKVDLSRNLVRSLRFGTEGYFFVYETGTGINRIHGANRDLEDKNLWDLTDPSGKEQIIQNLDRTAREKRLFHEYLWPKPGSTTQFRKLGTAMLVPGMDLWIGTGTYVDEIDERKAILQTDLARMEREMKGEFLIASLTVALASILLIILFSSTITRPIQKLISSSEKIRDGHYDVEITLKSSDEIGILSRTFIQMATKIKEYTENLESMVQERTKDLTITMNKLNDTNRIYAELSDKLSKYVSPQIRDEILTGKQDVIIGSKRKKLTIFFSDIKNFTQTTERLETEVLAELLNNYLDEMAHIATRHGATIDKYIGDAIMLFFGDPGSQGTKNDALACVRMAIEMRSRIRELQKEWMDRGLLEPFHIRMGINTGFCTVGNFGSLARMDYTIIGSQVNLASRLESSAAVDQILISHETYALVKDVVYCEKKESVNVKGIAYPVQTYEVVDLNENMSRNRIRIEESFDGFSVLVDMAKLTEKNRMIAARTLRNAMVEMMKPTA